MIHLDLVATRLGDIECGLEQLTECGGYGLLTFFREAM